MKLKEKKQTMKTKFQLISNIIGYAVFSFIFIMVLIVSVQSISGGTPNFFGYVYYYIQTNSMDGDYEDLEGDEKPIENMRVSIDPYMLFGTTLLVNEELLQKTREEMGNFYIIPSSVYEVILVKAEMTDAESLRGMIGEVNTNVVSDEDFLSNNAYYYDGKLQIAA